MDREPKLVSFVLRFVYEGAPEGTPEGDANASAAPAWHGVIRHVQSSAERHFVRWEEAMGFIGEYVDVGQAKMEPDA